MSVAREQVLEVRDLKVHFPIRGSFGRTTGIVRAVDGVSIELGRGETLGIAGESGCGKSTLARAMLRIVEPTAGRVVVGGDDVTAARGPALRHLLKVMQMVFQDPNDSLNPRVKVGAAIEEALIVAHVPPQDRPHRVQEILRTVGLPYAFARRYPHELSGGQRQRVGIARALAVGPQLLVCDEPVSALDVSVRAQIINLFQDLQEQLGLGYVFISHDLAVLRQMSHRVAVMYLGRVVEQAPNRVLYSHPLHPYTQALLGSVPLPSPKANRTRQRIHLVGEVPSPSSPPPGCPFHPRCPIAQEVCRQEVPPLREIASGRQVACHFAQENVWAGGERVGQA